jgi:alkylhydroperoxidase/carboxymuconolactone decarboxylase family protein YurZ
MAKQPPAQLTDLSRQYPEVWSAFTALAEACHENGIAIGMRHEGAVHSAVRHAIASGVSPEEIRHVALLAVTTLGWPAAHAALTWIEDVISPDAAR